MISEIDSKQTSDPLANSQVNKPQAEANLFEQGLESFQNLLTSLNPFDQQQEQTSDSGQAITVSGNKVDDIAQEVTRNVFGTSLLQPDNPLNFSADDITALQNSLIGALKASLLSSAAGSGQTSPVATQESSTPSLFTDRSFGNFLDSAKRISFGEDGFDMKDAFDAVNILNHIPIVSDIYKDTTSSEVNAFSSVTGGFLIGGPIGAAFAVADVATKEITGSSIFDNLIDYGKEAIDDFWGSDTPENLTASKAQTRPAPVSQATTQ